MMKHARSLLFVPGDRPDRFAKAAESGADQIILDLEDAVAIADKAIARANVQAALAQPGLSAVVRINDASTAWHAADISALAALPGLAGLMVPKAEDPSQFDRIACMVGQDLPLYALVETVTGVASLDGLCRSPRVYRLAFGTIDLQVDAGITGDGIELDAIRTMMVLASRLHNLPAPLEGVTTDLSDDSRLSAATTRSRRFGFGGKLCVHPRQVPIVNAAFRPSADEIAWARRVVMADDGRNGVASVDGRMVDKPVIEQARRLLAQ
jgi:citrate lyase subunit beta / citryl-CoA lyase